MLIAIDTATRYAGIALLDTSKDRILGEETWYSVNNHTVQLMPRLSRLLEQQGVHPTELKAIAVSLGPGSFTGLRIGLGVAKGFPVDVALGTVDAYEWSASSRGQLRVWHHALNNDFQVTPTGGEDSISNLHVAKVVGSLRTFAYTGRRFSASAWLDALRAGRTFFSSGPLLEFEINGRKPGECVRLGPEGGRIKLSAVVRSIAPLSKVVIHHNGEEYSEIPLSADGLEARYAEEAAVRESGWFSLYAEGPRTDVMDVDYPQAATNAIRVYVGDQKIRDRTSAEYFIEWVNKLETMAEKWPWWRSQRERNHVLAQFERAREVYIRRAEE